VGPLPTFCFPAGDGGIEAVVDATPIIDGRTWTRPTSPYQGKCHKWIRDTFNELSPVDADVVRDVSAGTGVDAILP
jgi:hypothetical protein